MGRSLVSATALLLLRGPALFAEELGRATRTSSAPSANEISDALMCSVPSWSQPVRG